jgi:protein involved in polysaccharide export with SLBB domain
MLVGAAPLFAQLESSPTLQDLLRMQSPQKSSGKLLGEVPSTPLDAPVDPSAYMVGPGDILALNVWSSAPVEQQLTVTPEGYLLITNVGALDLKGQSLKEAREIVCAAVGKKYLSSTVTLTLLAPRKVSVQITGQVIDEGMFELSSLQRADHLIEQANTLPSMQLTKKFYDTDQRIMHGAASQRHVVVHHQDGTDQRVDFVRFALTGDSRWNQYLREGDKVFVPARSGADNSIGVYGGINREISVEFVEGDSLKDLVALGLGFRPRAHPEGAVLARLSLDGRTMDTIRIDLRPLAGGKAVSFALRPGDRLVVPEDRELRLGSVVRIGGAVVSPGMYPITSTSTKLSEVVRAAGGITPEANLRASSLLRVHETKDIAAASEIERERLLSLRAGELLEDSSYYLAEAALKLNGELVSTDFKRLFADGDSTQDVTLRPYDNIDIPSYTHTVFVFGQVALPGHIQYKSGEGLGYYLDLAGGVTDLARRGDTKIIKAGSHSWLEPSKTEIEDGDLIFVPKEITRPFGYYLSTIAQFATVIASLATVILVVKTIK